MLQGAIIPIEQRTDVSESRVTFRTKSKFMKVNKCRNPGGLVLSSTYLVGLGRRGR